MKKTCILLMATAHIAVVSCKKDPDHGPVTSQVQYFPNKVGYNWAYRLIDTQGDTQNILVSITGVNLLPNGDSVNCWLYSYQNFTDTLWVHSDSNWVTFYYNYALNNPNYMQYVKMRYKVPFTVASVWTSSVYFGDTTRVSNQENVQVLAGLFHDSYKLLRIKPPITNSWITDTIWFKQKVGIVKLNQQEFDLGPAIGNGVWELVSYNVQ
ncbi:MAG: hypothetical protein NTU44_08155 [Bacteroidetes bacterium]|nr:hypothetical protein [Bacteroidota bacterium]